MRVLSGALAASSFLSAGCAGLNLRLINAGQRPPSNVAVFFTVDRRNGDPVPGLTADRFRIYEDDRPVSQLEAQQTIINPQVAAVHYTMLLLDLSGSVTESGQLPVLQASAQAFSEHVGPHQRVGVYGFDGTNHLYPLVPFTEDATQASGGIANLTSFRPQDPSTNLHGAVVMGLQTLEQSLQRSSMPLRFGTLVVFTDGTDRANRTSREEMNNALRQSQYNVFAIGLGAELDVGELNSIGRNGTVIEVNQAQIQNAFVRIAQRIEGYTQRFYLLSYCSPARAGDHRVRIEAVTADGASGSIEHGFSANGFAPGCNPNQLPDFRLTVPAAATGAPGSSGAPPPAGANQHPAGHPGGHPAGHPNRSHPQ